MKIGKLATGDLDISLDLRELETIGQCLNEVCHGFRVPDFKTRVGADKDYVVNLLDQIVAMYPSTMHP